MHGNLSKLASVLLLAAALPCWADRFEPQAPSERAAPAPAAPRELELLGELQYYRHIDTVTGRGAVSLYANGKEFPLDFRQFKPDILLPSGNYKVRGHWGKEKRLVVTAAHPA